MKVELIQDKIDLLLTVRKFIDDTRMIKKSIRQGKESADNAGMQADFENVINNRDKALLSLGFNSLEEFHQFNNEMCIAELQAYMPLLSYCDNCKGYTGTSPCELTCGQTSLHYKWTGSQDDIDRFWNWIITLVRQITYSEDRNTLVNVPDSIGIPTKLRSGMKMSKEVAANFSICPEGHGFRFDYVRDPQFDVSWS